MAGLRFDSSNWGIRVEEVLGFRREAAQYSPGASRG
jgi:hypothetical protein